jgi:hypothetical protein
MASHASALAFREDRWSADNAGINGYATGASPSSDSEYPYPHLASALWRWGAAGTPRQSGMTRRPSPGWSGAALPSGARRAEGPGDRNDIDSTRMGGLLAIILAVGLPPTDDGAGCEAWVANRARELAVAPQPRAKPLGADGPGLADLDPSIWTSFVPAVPPSTPENRDRFVAALDGRTAISTAPELVDAARRVEPQLRTFLSSARGARNILPAPFPTRSKPRDRDRAPSSRAGGLGVS